MNCVAPLLSALMTILRSTGPVISTRRSIIPGAGGGPCHVGSLRMLAVWGRKSAGDQQIARLRHCMSLRLRLSTARAVTADRVQTRRRNGSWQQSGLHQTPQTTKVSKHCLHASTYLPRPTPASISYCLVTRLASSSFLLALKHRCRIATNFCASTDRI